jgi:phosphate transport system substrate-binding protein
MNSIRSTLSIFAVFLSMLGRAQPGDAVGKTGTPPLGVRSASAQNVVVVTGARFSYKLMQKWIDEFNKENPSIQIIIESRGSSDHSRYDVLAEVFEPNNELLSAREFLYVGRYAILPVASSRSAFAKAYAKKGLTNAMIKQLYFRNGLRDKDEEIKIKAPYTVYTRMQKAGVPFVFASYFGYQQKDIQGHGIAGSDEHLLKAVIRDSTGISYLPVPLIYDNDKVVNGLTVLPVDLDGNDKVSDDERFYESLSTVVQRLESADPASLNNLPVSYLHLSVDRQKASSEALAFLKWVHKNGQRYLQEYGYMKAETRIQDNQRFQAFISRNQR